MFTCICEIALRKAFGSSGASFNPKDKEKWITLIQFLVCIIGMVATAVADFAPQVHWSCSSSTVSVFVQSPSPFKGLISTKEATANECRSVGVGSNVAVLKLALRNNHCGVRYNNELDQYMVTIEIHTHSIVIVDEDVVLNVTCRGNRKTSTNVPTRDKLTLSVRENGAGRSVGEVLHANPYTLAVESNSTKVNFRVGNCSLRSENYSPIELTDSRGCALYPSLLTDFKSAGNGWYAAISPMFRFPPSARITFSCHVLRCRGECTTYPCGERNSVTRRSGTETIILAESLHTTVLLRDKPEAATLMQAYEQASQTNTDCDMSNDNGMMCILCVILSGKQILLLLFRTDYEH
ncbi:zona pellucida-like domain protein, partial [Teladorsagia circumcincta]